MSTRSRLPLVKNLLMLCCFAAACIVGSRSAWAAETSERVALFADMQFRRGFHLSYPSSKMGWQVAAVLQPEDCRLEPAWRLCQWGTRHSLADATRVSQGGETVFENGAKKVIVAEEGSGQADLVLEIRGSAEYERRVRRHGEPWPHLLVEQHAVERIPLSRLESVGLVVDVKLLHLKSNMDASYDPSLHTAQFQLFLIVKNIDSDSHDFGNFLWFGVPLFDQRHEFPLGHKARDAGKEDATGKFIYSIPGRDVLPEPMKPGRWIHVEKDLRPAILDALKEAVARRFLHTADPSRYAVVNMNLGWELPGNFDAAVQVRGLEVFAAKKR